MIDLSNVKHHPAMEEIVEVLCNRTQNTDKGFFRTSVAYFLGKMASAMRATVVTKDRGEIPVNIYALALATSGYGKGHSVNIMENDFLGGFRRQFIDHSLPHIAEVNLWHIAHERAARDGGDPQEIYDEKVKKEYDRKGPYYFAFDSGSSPAAKQMREKLIMANAGSLNLQIDEIGLNLLANTELLTLYLEIYDQGLVKPKLTKNTGDNKRSEEYEGKTPANMMLFGHPNKLLDGGETEEKFFDFLETGYARRCIFGWGQAQRKSYHTKTPEEIYQQLTKPDNSTVVDKWAQHFTSLADPSKFGWKMTVEDDVGIQLLRYKIQCEIAADQLSDHEEMRKAELTHRYFRALKLAGIYAFIDEDTEVTMDHLMQAILLVEESGKSFEQLLKREKSYMKLARYIATCGMEVTHADLHEALPFYKSGQASRNELMTLASAWGYKQHILIKKRFVDSIEFFRGETLEETDLDKLILSYSNHWADDYTPDYAPFEALHQLTSLKDMHWANHHFENEHRSEEYAIPGFNMIVLDIDQGTPMAVAIELLKEYKFFLHTTKRHTKEANRFRMVIPINYKLELDQEEYRQFMVNLMNWLPFKVDEQTNQRARKWMTCYKSGYHYNKDGKLLDVLQFIPETAKNEQFQAEFKQIESLSNLERWFAARMEVGNRNNNMLRYAMALVDSGMSLMDAEKAIYAFNDKIQNPLRRDEIQSTILRSVAKRYVSS